MSSDATRSFAVPAEDAGARLDAWLAGAADVSRSAAAAMAEEGRVTVAGERRGKAHRLAGGERVEVAPAVEVERPAAPAARTVFENEDLWVIDKPAGLVVHPAAGHAGVTLVERLGAGEGRAFAVHRLDRDTSGLMIVARSPGVRDELQRLIRRREVEREYLALACGRLGSRSGTIDAPVGRDPRVRARMSVQEGGRDARTHFEVIEFRGDYTYLRVRLETGRTHQIRVHMAAIGHPVAGDPAYGGAGRLGLERQFLHSARLRFAYSGAPDAIDVSSELPADLTEALARAG